MLMQCMYVYIRNERVDFLFQHQDLLILLPTANQKHMYFNCNWCTHAANAFINESFSSQG